MTRTRRYKVGYLAALAMVGVAACFAIVVLGGGMTAVVIVAVLLLVPGRLNGIFYRDLFRGRRLLDVGQSEASIPYTSRFLDQIRRHPGRKRLLWLAWSVYTPDAEAMALNNLGAAHLRTGDFAAAADALRSAIAVDPQYPIPYYNLAIERAVAHDHSEAARLAAEAERLGFRRTRIDDILLEAQALWARLEGRGAAASSAGN